MSWKGKYCHWVIFWRENEFKTSVLYGIIYFPFFLSLFGVFSFLFFKQKLGFSSIFQKLHWNLAVFESWRTEKRGISPGKHSVWCLHAGTDTNTSAAKRYHISRKGLFLSSSSFSSYEEGNIITSMWLGMNLLYVTCIDHNDKNRAEKKENVCLLFYLLA